MHLFTMNNYGSHLNLAIWQAPHHSFKSWQGHFYDNPALRALFMSLTERANADYQSDAGSNLSDIATKDKGSTAGEHAAPKIRPRYEGPSPARVGDKIRGANQTGELEAFTGMEWDAMARYIARFRVSEWSKMHNLAPWKNFSEEVWLWPCNSLVIFSS